MGAPTNSYLQAQTQNSTENLPKACFYWSGGNKYRLKHLLLSANINLHCFLLNRALSTDTINNVLDEILHPCISFCIFQVKLPTWQLRNLLSGQLLFKRELYLTCFLFHFVIVCTGFCVSSAAFSIQYQPLKSSA